MTTAPLIDDVVPTDVPRYANYFAVLSNRYSFYICDLRRPGDPLGYSTTIAVIKEELRQCELKASYRFHPRGDGALDRRPRVLLLTTELGQGGAERVFHTHATDFSHFADVEEAVFESSTRSRIYETALPLNVVKSRLPNLLGSVGRLFGRSTALRRLVLRRSFDVVISHMDGANWVNALSSSPARKILVVHGTILGDGNFQGWKQWLRLWLVIPLLYRRAAYTVAVSEGIANELRAVCGVKNVVVMKNYFEVTEIEEKSRMSIPDWARPAFQRDTVITMGRLAPQKNQGLLISALRDLKERGISACLIILGDGPLKQSLLAQCTRLGLRTFDRQGGGVPNGNEDVCFFGFQDNPFAFVARGTVFALPSLWEGYPLALCEAIICGVPVVSADCPTGPREIIICDHAPVDREAKFLEVHDNGILVPSGSGDFERDQWVQALETLLRNDLLRRRLSENARASSLPSKEQSLKIWADLIGR